MPRVVPTDYCIAACGGDAFECAEPTCGDPRNALLHQREMKDAPCATCVKAELYGGKCAGLGDEPYYRFSDEAIATAISTAKSRAARSCRAAAHLIEYKREPAWQRWLEWLRP